MTEDKYEVMAEYHVEKRLTVLVKRGADPLDPANWIEIESEHDIDGHLYDVHWAREVRS